MHLGHEVRFGIDKSSDTQSCLGAGAADDRDEKRLGLGGIGFLRLQHLLHFFRLCKISSIWLQPGICPSSPQEDSLLDLEILAARPDMLN